MTLRVSLTRDERRPTRPHCVSLITSELHIEAWHARESDAHRAAARLHRCVAVHHMRQDRDARLRERSGVKPKT